MSAEDSSTTIMGVLNCTPDSFYDGEKVEVETRVHKALDMIQNGASIIDIGGESSKPGSEPVSLKEELERTIPVIKQLRQQSQVSISIDTTKAKVAEAAIQAGATIINDISSGSDPDMLSVSLDHPVKVIHMHMQGQPKTMQNAPSYKNVVNDVLTTLTETREHWLQKGFKKENLWWDPGIGFGKTLEHNLALLKNLNIFNREAQVVLGVSRKSFIAKIDSHSKGPEDRLSGSLAPLGLAWDAGVRIFRVHDVFETRQFMAVHERLRS